VGFLLATAALVVLLGAGAHRALSAGEKRRFPPPGELVDVGGYRIHLHRRGRGEPTVVLDSALAGTTLSWADVAPVLSESTRVVSYDRAGFGWSDPSPLTRRVDHFVTELRLALEAARIDPPYVLVGHSYGGWIARLFASAHPEELAGLVLVDVPHPREWSNPSEEQRRRLRRSVRLATFAAWLAPLGVVRAALRIGRGRKAEGRRISSLLAKVPPSRRSVIRSFWVQAATLRALASLMENAPASAAMVDERSRPLGDIPLVVLTASSPSEARLRDQEEVLSLSTRGRHVVAEKSGHWIPLDEPELVVEAVRSVLGDSPPALTGAAGSDRNRPFDGIR
jgi:pimeloyl-ACP methyl ester carboxylesterase